MGLGYWTCPDCGERVATTAHTCGGMRAKVIDPRGAELATLQAKLAESEAQRAVLVGALGGFVGLVENNWKGMEGVFYDPMPTCEQLPEAYLALQNALASQPPSDLVALVKAVGVFRQHEGRCQTNQDAGNLKDHVVRRLELLGETYAALDALLTNQPGFRALIDREDV